jgi:hypothetical protein
MPAREKSQFLSQYSVDMLETMIHEVPALILTFFVVQFDLGSKKTVNGILSYGHASCKQGLDQNWIAVYDIYVSVEGSENEWAYKVIAKDSLSGVLISRMIMVFATGTELFLQ